MIMDSMKKMTTDRAKTSYNGIPYWFKRSIINTQLLPEYADKWINYLTNPELEECFINASINVYGDNFMEMVEEIGHGDVWLLFCGEFFDCIKDKVIEKYRVEKACTSVFDRRHAFFDMLGNHFLIHAIIVILFQPWIPNQ